MTTFDALAYFEKLKAAGVPEEQARVQANAFRDFSAIQEKNNRKELATKADLRESELRLQKEIEVSKRDILKWLIGLLLTQSALLIAVFAFLK
ncbi:MAG: CCDC90 family protein [Desulfovibrio sp.]|nr:CCDC90 family protein [Desulfovibrio sp.]